MQHAHMIGCVDVVTQAGVPAVPRARTPGSRTVGKEVFEGVCAKVPRPGRARATTAPPLAGNATSRPDGARRELLRERHRARCRAVGSDLERRADRRAHPPTSRRRLREWRPVAERRSPYRADWKRGRVTALADDDRPQADRDPLHRHEPRLLRPRRDPGADHAHAARDAERALRDAADLQPAVHDPRDDDGLPRRRPDPRRASGTTSCR